MLTGRSAFIETYNSLVATGKVFGYDVLRDRYYYDGREITGAVLAELRGVVAQDGSADRSTLRDAVRALCMKHPLDQRKWPEAIAAVGNELAIQITIHGVPHWCVAMRDLKQALDVRRGDSTKQINQAMRGLGWQCRPVFIYGHRMRGFVQRIES
jgi:hypothetical protein